MVAPPGEASFEELRQGDVLERNSALSNALREAHQYYADADGYDYFLVLTPSCELVRRNGGCSSRYITLAAIRPLSLLVERQLQNYKKSVKAPGLFCSLEKRGQAEQFLMRILHNTEEGYLFLPGELFAQTADDRCAFLKLSIAMRASHYDTCLSAKVFQLAEDFSARVGALTANLYGQVATEALEEQADINVEEIIREFKSRTLDRHSIYWLSRQQIKVIDKAAKAKRAELGRDLTEPETDALVNSTPTDQKLLASRIGELMAQKNISDEAGRREFVNLLSGDQNVAQFLR